MVEQHRCPRLGGDVLASLSLSTLKWRICIGCRHRISRPSREENVGFALEVCVKWKYMWWWLRLVHVDSLPALYICLFICLVVDRAGSREGATRQADCAVVCCACLSCSLDYTERISGPKNLGASFQAMNGEKPTATYRPALIKQWCSFGCILVFNKWVGPIFSGAEMQ